MPPTLQDMQRVLEDHVRREQQLGKLMKAAEAEQSVAKEAIKHVGNGEETPTIMSHEAIAKYLKTNY